MSTRMEIHATWTREALDTFTDPEVAATLDVVRKAQRHDPERARAGMRAEIDKLDAAALDRAYEPLTFAIRYLQGLRAAMTSSAARRRRAVRAARASEI